MVIIMTTVLLSFGENIETWAHMLRPAPVLIGDTCARSRATLSAKAAAGTCPSRRLSPVRLPDQGIAAPGLN
jgi:hypothetical protein